MALGCLETCTRVTNSGLNRPDASTACWHGGVRSHGWSRSGLDAERTQPVRARQGSQGGSCALCVHALAGESERSDLPYPLSRIPHSPRAFPPVLALRRATQPVCAEPDPPSQRRLGCGAGPGLAALLAQGRRREAERARTHTGKKKTWRSLSNRTSFPALYPPSVAAFH